MQNPRVTAVGTFETWKRVGRSVKKGEKALTILQPRPIRARSRHKPESDRTDEAADGTGVIMTFRSLPVFDPLT
jgi:hypothetical protein